MPLVLKNMGLVWNRLRLWLQHAMHRLLACWDVCLLALILAAMAGMLAYLLWPRPEYVLTIDRFADPVPSVAVASVQPAAAAVNRPKAHRKRLNKSPVKPPVLNINTANAGQLDLLPGIGPALAERIVQYRKSSGPFASIEQIQEVSGIGPKKFQKMQPYLRI